MRHTEETSFTSNTRRQVVHAASFEVAPLRNGAYPKDHGVPPESRHFHTGQQNQAEPVGHLDRLRHTAVGVVIGQRDGVIAGLTARLEHGRHAILAVAVQRVQVRLELEQPEAARGVASLRTWLYHPEMLEAPHPDSVLRTESGREVQLKVHQCVWSGEFPGNSLAAIRECYRAHVARAEIDLAMLADRDFLVVHDLDLARATDGCGLVSELSARRAEGLHLAHAGHPTGEPVPLLSQVVDTIASEPYPTLLELDLKDHRPWPWRRVEELAALLEPVRDRITFGGGADCNLSRLHQVDSGLAMGFTISEYLDWLPPEAWTGVRNAYGYLDAHPRGSQRFGPTRDYLRERLDTILSLVPTARDIHIRLSAAIQMVRDGFTDLTELLHARGMLLDVWTLNAGTPGWRERLAAAVALGADVITTETPRELARVYSDP